MARIAFDFAEVEELMDHAEKSPDWAMGFGDEGATPEPGLFLVGDHGVYLMSNGRPSLPRKDGKPGNHVVYAKGMNPEVDDFDDWWAMKNTTFGGDDGAELLPIIPMLRKLRKEQPDLKDVTLEVTSKDISLVYLEKPKG